MSNSPGTARRRRSIPPDRLAAVLEEVDQARRGGGWLPEEPSEKGRRKTPRAARPTQEDQAPRHLRSRPDDGVRPHTPLVRPPRTLADAVVAPGRVAAVAVLVLVVMAGTVLGARVLWLRATSEPQPVAPMAPTRSLSPAQTPRAGPALTQRTPATRAGGTATTAASTLLVHVVGQVRKPGVVTLKSGARVRDALVAAGGALDTADLRQLNLARAVADGEQVVVPKPGESLTSAPTVPAPSGGAVATGAPLPPGSSAGSGEVVNLNQADAAALEQLPGVGPVLAGRIVQWRTDNGQFTSVEELSEVSGIGEKMLAQLRPHVTV